MEGAVGCVKGCQPFLSFLDADLVVSGLHVKLGEDPGSLYTVHDLVNPGEGVGILDGDVIEFLVVDHWSFCAVFLSDKEDWGGSGALVRASGDHASV